MNGDGSFNLDGLSHAPVFAGSDSQATAKNKLANNFLFDGNTWTLQFGGKVVFETDLLGLPVAVDGKVGNFSSASFNVSISRWV